MKKEKIILEINNLIEKINKIMNKIDKDHKIMMIITTIITAITYINKWNSTTFDNIILDFIMHIYVSFVIAIIIWLIMIPIWVKIDNLSMSIIKDNINTKISLIKNHKIYKKYSWVLKYLIIFKIIKWIIIIIIIIIKYKG